MKPLVFYGGLSSAKISWRKLTGHGRIFILMYHRVDCSGPPFFEVAVKPDTFEKQIVFLKKHYEIADLGDLRTLESNQTFRKDVVVLTFDDGYRGNFGHVFPILKKYQVPATIFLATRYIGTNRLLWHDEVAWILYKTAFVPDTMTLAKYDLPSEVTRRVERFFRSSFAARLRILRSLAAILKVFSSGRRQEIVRGLAKACGVREWPSYIDRPMLSWEEIREMSRHGVSFGSHTVSHPVLSNIAVQEARSEIVESKKAIEEVIQMPVTTFAYPFGKEEDYSTHIVKILKDEGFEYACSTIRGYEQIPPETPLVLKRRGVPPHPYLLL